MYPDGLQDPDQPYQVKKSNKWNDKKFVFAFFFSLCISATVWIYSQHKTVKDDYSNGVDSWGNRCGWKNTAVVGAPMSGSDMRDYGYEFVFAYLDPKYLFTRFNYYKGLHARLCVRQCPGEVTTCRSLIKDYLKRTYISENGTEVVITEEVIRRRICSNANIVVLPHTTRQKRCFPLFTILVSRLSA